MTTPSFAGQSRIAIDELSAEGAWLLTFTRHYPANVNDDRPASADPVGDSIISVAVRTNSSGALASLVSMTTDLHGRLLTLTYAEPDGAKLVVQDWKRCTSRTADGPQGDAGTMALSDIIGSLTPPGEAVRDRDGTVRWQERQGVVEARVTQASSYWIDRSIAFYRPTTETEPAALLFSYEDIRFNEVLWADVQPDIATMDRFLSDC